MFSKYKKTAPAPKTTASRAPAHDSGPQTQAEKDAKPEAPRKALMRANPKPAQVAPKDKEVKRKERLGEIKLELHKALLDNLREEAKGNPRQPAPDVGLFRHV